MLESIPYFSGLGATELADIRKLVSAQEAERGDIILLEGDAGGGLFFVASGAVKMFRTSVGGKEQVLEIVRPGESFNDVPAFDGGPNLASAQAMGLAMVYRISQEDLAELLVRYPRIAINTADVLAEKARRLVALIEDLSFRPVLGRVARVLLEYAGDGIGPGQRLTQQDMAAIAGTAREVVSRSLKVLEAEGKIKMERHRIVVRDKEALENLVGVSS